MTFHLFIFETGREGSFTIPTKVTDTYKLYCDDKMLVIHKIGNNLESDFTFQIPVFSDGKSIGHFTFDYDSIKDTKYVRTKLLLNNDSTVSISIIAAISEPLREPIVGNRSYSLPHLYVVGHRGSGNNLIRRDFLENSIEAAKNAFKEGADMIEFDVQLACDMTPIVAHDFYLRTKEKLKDREVQSVDDKGRNMYFNSQITVDEHKENGKETDFPDTKRATFKEMMTETDPRLGFTAEIKYPSSPALESKIKFVERNIYTQRVLDEIETYCGERKNIFLISFDILLMSMFAVKQTKWPIIQCMNLEPNETQEHLILRMRSALPLFKELGFTGVSTDPKTFDGHEELFDEITSQGLIIITYSNQRNRAEDYEYLFDHGVSGIMNEYPQFAKSVIAAYEQKKKQ